MLSIQCLNLIILITLFCPALIMQSIFGQNGGNSKTVLYAITIFHGILLILVYILLDENVVSTFRIEIKGLYFWFMGIIIGILIFIVEILISHLINSIKNRKFLKLKLDIIGIGNKSDIILSLLNAIFEELIYRWIWITILITIFKLPILLAILISSIAFAYNHRLLGIEIFVSKFFTGIILGCTYMYFDNILIPIVAHLVMNLIVGLLACRRRYV